ncbi:MAG: exonuclease SbcCD subunit D [Oscillospiraceae bacterium]|nr:exonuclease SbcCD subunit D [Oscillospiraceae bacterium]
MKFLHLADLHLGKRLHDYSLLDDQQEVLAQALQTAKDKQCDAVLIAGDVYDRAAPSVDAMCLFDSFLTGLCEAGLPSYIISGNHDAAGRISYFSGLLEKSGVHVSAAFDGKLQSFASPDGSVLIHLLPFIRPMDVRRCYPEEEIATYEDAVKAVLAHSPIDQSRVNLLVSHQFITGASTCESEEFAIGGLDNIGAEVFDAFDYVALGHLHQPQSCRRNTVRYAGSPLKYSLSEEHQNKSFLIVDVRGKGDITFEQVPVRLPHDVRTVSGTFEELQNTRYTEDYVRVVLTDEIVPPDARITLRSTFPNMVKFSVENSKTSTETDVAAVESFQDKSPLELFADFFAFQNNDVSPTEEQLAIVRRIFTELEEEQV